MDSLALHVDQEADPAWTLKQLRRLDPIRRHKICLLPYHLTFRSPFRGCWWVQPEDMCSSEYQALWEAVDGAWEDEIRHLLLHGASPNHGPITDAFRDHPEVLPTMLGLDPRLDNLIAARLKRWVRGGFIPA